MVELISFVRICRQGDLLYAHIDQGVAVIDEVVTALRVVSCDDIVGIKIGSQGKDSSLIIAFRQYFSVKCVGIYLYDPGTDIYILKLLHDQVGGIDLELTEGEAANINWYLKKNAKSILKHYDTKEAKAARVELKVEDGVQHLDGLQALMYARLRQNKTRKKYNLGDDWQRTVRARNLLDKLLQKVLKGNTDIIDLVSFSVEYINSNMNPATMFDLIRTVLGGSILNKLGSGDSIMEQFRIPMGSADDNTKTWSYVQEKGDLYGKIWLSKTNGNLQKNIEGLHEFIYGKYYPAGE